MLYGSYKKEDWQHYPTKTFGKRLLDLVSDALYAEKLTKKVYAYNFLRELADSSSNLSLANVNIRWLEQQKRRVEV